MSKFNSAQTAPRLACSHIAMSLLLAGTTWSGAAVADGADAVERPIAAAPESTALSDIVVTATRKETRLQSTPVAMSVIGEEFRRIGAAIKAGPYAGTLLLQGAQNPPRTIFFKVGYTY